MTYCCQSWYVNPTCERTIHEWLTGFKNFMQQSPSSLLFQLWYLTYGTSVLWWFTRWRTTWFCILCSETRFKFVRPKRMNSISSQALMLINNEYMELNRLLWHTVNSNRGHHVCDRWCTAASDGPWVIWEQSLWHGWCERKRQIKPPYSTIHILTHMYRVGQL